jgi:hypothetical protein
MVTMVSNQTLSDQLRRLLGHLELVGIKPELGNLALIELAAREPELGNLARTEQEVREPGLGNHARIEPELGNLARIDQAATRPVLGNLARIDPAVTGRQRGIIAIIIKMVKKRSLSIKRSSKSSVDRKKSVRRILISASISKKSGRR